MRPIIHSRAAGAIVLSGTLAVTAALAVSPAAAQTPAPAPQDPATTPAPADGAPPLTAVAASAPVKTQARLGIRSRTRDVVSGNRASVRGVLLPAKSGRRVTLQVRRGRTWTSVDHGHTTKTGAFTLRYRSGRTGTAVWRLTYGGDRTSSTAKRLVGHLNVYRRAMASWYSDYGGPLACGGTLGYNTQGVANKTLPCGTKVTLRYRGRSVRVPVIDRGPYIAGREFDLTGATKRALRFGDTGVVLTTR